MAELRMRLSNIERKLSAVGNMSISTIAIVVAAEVGELIEAHNRGGSPWLIIIVVAVTFMLVAMLLRVRFYRDDGGTGERSSNPRRSHFDMRT
jgi:uncharacterized membrane protein